MSERSVEDILELLDSIFMKCDYDGDGVVDVDTLINFLISQDPNWQGDERIKEELHKLLHCKKSSDLITKDEFIRLLLDWFESEGQGKEKYNSDEECVEKVGKYSSSSSGIGESSETTSASSTHSLEGNFNSVYFVSDRQALTNEDIIDEFSITDSESPRTNNRMISALENEINSLQRKNEYLERENSSLLSQVSSLEEMVARNEKETTDYVKRLVANDKLLERHKEKQECTEEKLILFAEEIKDVTIQLSQSERENTKLKEFISRLEKQMDCLLNEKTQQNSKIQDLSEKLRKLSDVHIQSEQELECLKIKENARKEAFESVMEQNSNLQSQLESSDILMQDLKSQILKAHKELSSFQNEKIKDMLQLEYLPDESTPDNSMVIFDRNFSFGAPIPLESSLLAELQRKVKLPIQDYGCVCIRNIYFSTSTASVETDHLKTSDAAVGTDDISLDISKITLENLQDYNERQNAICKDVGVNCCIKTTRGDEKDVDISCKLCHLKSKRSWKKWLALGLILLLLYTLLVFISVLFIFLQALKSQSNAIVCLPSLFELLHISVTYPDLTKSIIV